MNATFHIEGFAVLSESEDNEQGFPREYGGLVVDHTGTLDECLAAVKREAPEHAVELMLSRHEVS